MADPEPVQILEDPVDKLGTAATRIEIFDPEAERPAAGARVRVAHQGRIGVAEMEAPGRRRGETCDLQDSLHDKGDRGDS